MEKTPKPLDEDIKVSVYFDNPSQKEDDEMQLPFKVIMKDFETFVRTIGNITNSIRKSNFDPKECTEVLDMYYGYTWTTVPDRKDNYYYVLTTPELKNIENALEILEFDHDIDVSKERKYVDVLKKELWQLLPDFYQGHTNPFPKPLTYDPGKPYPLPHISDSFSEERRERHRMYLYMRRLPDGIEKHKEFPEQDTVSEITLEDVATQGELKITADGIEIDISLRTVWEPYVDMLYFTESIIMNRNPAFLEIDEEGPHAYFFVDQTVRHENIRLVIYEWWEKEHVIKGVFNRQQLARELIKILEDADVFELNPDEVYRKTQRLKEMI